MRHAIVSKPVQTLDGSQEPPVGGRWSFLACAAHLRWRMPRVGDGDVLIAGYHESFRRAGHVDIEMPAARCAAFGFVAESGKADADFGGLGVVQPPHHVGGGEFDVGRPRFDADVVNDAVML